ncbi:hypothetical protein ACFSM5_10955 [Lacibacterium aquatile]|uniref:Uncharacterized protein n=1 Tax=Lacibacterium aquatile TaxID=1168082 RepID=A0ABW5DQL3_9PROT
MPGTLPEQKIFGNLFIHIHSSPTSPLKSANILTKGRDFARRSAGKNLQKMFPLSKSSSGED